MSEFSLTKNPNAALTRDLKRALASNQYEVDGAELVLPAAKVRMGGVFHSWVLRHESVQRALEAGDKLAAAAAAALVPRDSDLGCFRIMESADHNQIPDAGINYILSVIYGLLAKKTTWYHGPFKSNWTNFAGAMSNWAGATSGPMATELANAEYTEASRQPAVFSGVAVGKSMISSSATRFTLASGVSGITIYGSTLNSVNTVGYNIDNEVLLAASQFNTPKSGLGASDKIDLEYEVEGSST